MKKLMIIICIISLYQCKVKDKPQSTTNDSKREDIIGAVVLDSICAVFYVPDSIEMDSLENKMSPEEFNTLESDIDMYNTEAMNHIISKGIKVHVKNQRFYSFKKKNKGIVTIDKKKYSDWGIILFDMIKDPVILYPNEAPEKIDEYFNK